MHTLVYNCPRCPKSQGLQVLQSQMVSQKEEERK